MNFVCPGHEGHSSGVSWSAVIAGAFASATFFLILLTLGAGFGLSSVSPWSNHGISVSTLGDVAIGWLIFIEIVASALGGYLTGRLRTRWILTHSDEVHFRDSANGFLAWAVALVISVTLLASTAASLVGRVAQAGAIAATEGTAIDTSEPNGYFVDTLFRTNSATAGNKDASVQAEAGRILSRALRLNRISSADQDYLAQLVADKTGITPSQATKRVSDVMTEARQAEDTDRKVTARSVLGLFFTLLLGAFSASCAATVGGKQRDRVQAVRLPE